MLLDEKEYGLDILPSPEPSPTTTPARPRLTVQHPSTNSAMAFDCPTPKEEYDPTSTHPFSPFYSHPTTRTSLEQLKNCSSSNVAVKVYETDLESGSRTYFSPTPSLNTTRGESKVWPCRHQLVQKSIALKQSRGCNPLRKLSKKQKLWAKILIALFVIGAAVGIGIGVSLYVHAGVYKSPDQQEQIGKIS
ncbi:hypothetical protein MMC13_000449 [Lambiella insularis]|nr:hypothetical protein [Lambiella insularis]